MRERPNAGIEETVKRQDPLASESRSGKKKKVHLVRLTYLIPGLVQR